MARGTKTTYKVCAIYDTETCNYGEGASARAYVVCYQVNDLRSTRLDNYEAGKSDDIRIYRSEQEMILYIDDLIAWGKHYDKLPIVCAYNLMFDLKSLIYDLRALYDMQVSAQNSTSVYTLDLVQDGHVVLRFWDCFYLDQRGLAALGEVAGLPKATGEWDYTRVRTPDTPLTPDEIHYASRDVQVIPAYLRYLLDANSWLTSDMLGVRVITKTSLVRQMARLTLGPLKCTAKGKTTIDSAFIRLCECELPTDYETYALRKACFRGGLTFTAAAYACTVQHNVMSLDVTSMHHTFMASKVPVHFGPTRPKTLQRMCERIIATPRDVVLRRYYRPFDFAIHAKVRFRGVRIRRGSCFDAWGVGLLARGKFARRLDDYERWRDNAAARMQDESVRARGWHDGCYHGRFAFGKLYEAEECDVYLSEIELWCMSRVYEWDSMQALYGESTTRFDLPPDFVGLQSNVLYGLKSALKECVGTYREGEPYPGDVSPLVPDALTLELREGTLSADFLASYYQNTIKGMFNSIYGTQAQDLYKPDYMVTASGEVCVDSDKMTTPDNFADRKPKTPRVLYTYGMRIVGRSRMHLVLAMELLHEAFANHVRVTGGDTDSLKVSVDDGIQGRDLLDALRPLHAAADVCLARGYERIRREHGDLCSGMHGVGHFDAERCGRSDRYPYHMELWLKARVSIDTDGEPHVTCAGLSRPEGAYTILDHMRRRIREVGPEQAIGEGIGYNVYVTHAVSHALQRTDPRNDKIFEADVRDWQDHVSHVFAHEVYALYPSGRMLGEMTQVTNVENVLWLRERYGREVDCSYRVIDKEDEGHVWLICPHAVD